MIFIFIQAVGRNGLKRGRKMNSYYGEKSIYNSIQERYGIAGSSKLIQESLEILLQAAPTDLTILITGETGTGKEVFANAIHGLSKRSNRPFVSVNCGAIPENLLESELFGHEKGAYTSADDQRIGFFESANNGTIFLDEIGELPLGTQVKLLRVLESGEFNRLGSSKLIKVNVRIIAATNRELEREVQEGTFRQDLFFRLNSVRINLPPLRKRQQDIPALALHLAEKISKKLGFKFQGIDPEAQSILMQLPWSGNVRELKNLIETIITLEKTDYLTPETVTKYIPRALPAHRIIENNNKTSLVSLKKENDEDKNELALIFKTLLDMKNEMSDLKFVMNRMLNEIDFMKNNLYKSADFDIKQVDTEDEAYEILSNYKLDEIEKSMILRTLERFDGNRRLTAETLGVSERTLYRKLKDYGI
jgi:transcriptional regulator with PAS, ATPase and Fis domain